MPAQNRLAAKVREILSNHDLQADEMIDEIKATLPRPTLAEMSDNEREDCQWMLADVCGTKGEWAIGDSHHINVVHLVNRSGKCLTAAAKDVTPRPDLPRLEWPGDKNLDPATNLPDGWRLADHPKHGRVVVTIDTIHGKKGYVCLVFPTADPNGFSWFVCDPTELTFLNPNREA